MDYNRSYKSLFMGQGIKVPIINGKFIEYVDLDNAATTPPFKKVMDKVNEFSSLYSNIHRGSGFKSNLSTEIYGEARKIIAGFVGTDLTDNSVIFVKNSTEAINKLAKLYNLNDNDIVVCSQMEHHSNDLPWRKKAIVKYINVTDNGEIDMNHFMNLIESYKGRIKLVSVTGASNVTGYINPIHEIAKIAHGIGAKILIDASQLAPHRKINIKGMQDSEHIDFIVFTGHKLYAPFGSGVLIGSKEFFNNVDPDCVGGGTVKIVTENEVYWDETPEKNEAGTPNVIGAVALAVSIKIIQNIGFERIQEHEIVLSEYLFDKLRKTDNIEIYSDMNASFDRHLGVISFNINDINHSLVAAILSYEYGIGVRSGCFCAHPYVLKLLRVDRNAVERHKENILSNNKSQVPGLVRLSLGLQNTHEDIDRLIYALKKISNGERFGNYIIDKKTGTYMPEGWNSKYRDHFDFF
ncbi:MAG: aminotransferase class V-fold PLP-dependent enzyme [Bacillota bacterium]|nr:aminotransferase class V-fold PLP-dependent enzyme [Bacillota bacterium]